MPRLPSLTRDNWLALAILATLIVVVLGLVGAGVWWAQNRYAKLYAAERDTWNRYQRVIATKPEIESKLANINAREPRKQFLKSSGAAIAASELQDLVKSMIEGNGGRVITSQLPPHKDEGKYRQFTVNIMMGSNMPNLRRILHALEGARPSLFVDNLVVRSNFGFGYRPVPGVEPEMTVQFDVSGYALLAQ